MADLPMQRNADHCLQLQLRVMKEGLQLISNPLQRQSAPRYHTVGHGETIQIIAMREYEDVGMWRAIAAENRMEYPYSVWVGMVLRLPDAAN